MRILLVGGAGCIGGHAARRLKILPIGLPNPIAWY